MDGWSPSSGESNTSSTCEANVQIGSVDEQTAVAENTLPVEDVDIPV